MPIQNLDSLLPLPNQSRQLEMLSENQSASGDATKSRAMSQLLATRSPTPSQRDSMMKQQLATNLIRHYTKLVMLDEVRMVVFSFESIKALDRLTNFSSHMAYETRRNLGKFAENGHLDSIAIRPILDLLIPTIYGGIDVDINETFEPYEMRVISIVRDGYFAEEQTYQSWRLHTPASVEITMLNHENIAVRSTLTNLYCQDLFLTLNSEGRQGVALPRFFHGYPSRAMNEALIAKYATELMLMRRLLSDGLEIDQITRADMRLVAANLVKEMKA